MLLELEQLFQSPVVHAHGGGGGESQAAVQEAARLEGELEGAPVAGASHLHPLREDPWGWCSPWLCWGRGRWLGHSGAVTGTHRLPPRPTPFPSFCFSRSVLCLFLGGNQLLQHLCTFQHNEPLSGAFTRSRTKAQGNHRQEPWCCNTIVLSQVISAKNKLPLNNLQTQFHQTP